MQTLLLTGLNVLPTLAANVCVKKLYSMRIHPITWAFAGNILAGVRAAPHTRIHGAWFRLHLPRSSRSLPHSCLKTRPSPRRPVCGLKRRPGKSQILSSLRTPSRTTLMLMMSWIGDMLLIPRPMPRSLLCPLLGTSRHLALTRTPNPTIRLSTQTRIQKVTTVTIGAAPTSQRLALPPFPSGLFRESGPLLSSRTDMDVPIKKTTHFRWSQPRRNRAHSSVLLIVMSLVSRARRGSQGNSWLQDDLPRRRRWPRMSYLSQPEKVVLGWNNPT